MVYEKYNSPWKLSNHRIHFPLIQANDLKDALNELSVSVKPEEHQMLEKTLDIDGIYNKYKLVFWIKWYNF